MLNKLSESETESDFYGKLRDTHNFISCRFIT